MLDVPTTRVAYVKVTPTILIGFNRSQSDNHLVMWIGFIAIRSRPVASVDRPLLIND